MAPPWLEGTSTQKLFRQLRRIYLRLSYAGLGALALNPAPLSASTGQSTRPRDPIVVTVPNREKRPSAVKKLVLSLASGERVLRAAHRSHRAFTFRMHTQVRRLSPTETSQPLNVILAETPGVFPISKDQEILVHWAADNKLNVRMAAKFTLLE